MIFLPSPLMQSAVWRLNVDRASFNAIGTVRRGYDESRQSHRDASTRFWWTGSSRQDCRCRSSRPVNEIKRIWRRASHRVVVARRYLLPSQHSDLSIDHPPASLRHKEPRRVVESSPLDRDWTVMTRNNDEAASRSGRVERERGTRPRDFLDFVLGRIAVIAVFFTDVKALVQTSGRVEIALSLRILVCLMSPDCSS